MTDLEIIKEMYTRAKIKYKEHVDDIFGVTILLTKPDCETSDGGCNSLHFMTDTGELVLTGVMGRW